VKQPFARIIERLGCDDFTTQIAEVGEPFSCVKRKLCVDVFSYLLSESRTGTRSGDGDLKVPSPNDGRKIKIAKRRIVYSVAEDALCGRLRKDSAIDGRHIGSRYDEKAAGQVAVGVGPLPVLDLSGGSEALNALVGVGSDNRDLSIRSLKRFDLGFSQISRSNHDAWAGSELEEDGKERHRIFL